MVKSIGKEFKEQCEQGTKLTQKYEQKVTCDREQCRVRVEKLQFNKLAENLFLAKDEKLKLLIKCVQ